MTEREEFHIMQEENGKKNQRQARLRERHMQRMINHFSSQLKEQEVVRKRDSKVERKKKTTFRLCKPKTKKLK